MAKLTVWYTQEDYWLREQAIITQDDGSRRTGLPPAYHAFITVETGGGGKHVIFMGSIEDAGALYQDLIEQFDKRSTQ